MPMNGKKESKGIRSSAFLEDLSSSKEDARRQRLDVVFLRQGGKLIHRYLGDHNLTRRIILLGQLGENGSEDLAGLAPGCGEFHNNQGIHVVMRIERVLLRRTNQLAKVSQRADLVDL